MIHKTPLGILIVGTLLSSVPVLSQPHSAHPPAPSSVPSSVSSSSPSSATVSLRWRELSPGVQITRHEIIRPDSILRSAVTLVRFDPKKFRFTPVQGSDVGTARSDIRQLTNAVGGVAGINANFFDPTGAPLGLIVKSGKTINRPHRSGNTLTALLVERNGRWEILHRSELQNGGLQEGSYTTALQAGPRLIANGAAVKSLDSQDASRRSGVAIQRDGSIIFFATLLRFPGATLPEIQEMLLSYDIQDAINFDGGGSSQLFVNLASEGKEETLISGGDLIPVALVAVRK